MKSPIRSSKTAAPVTAAKYFPKNPGKMALANVAYNASEKKTVTKDHATEKSPDQQATKKKQAAAQKS